MPTQISLRFDGLAAADGDVVSPALPRLLQLLSERAIRATFVVDGATAEAEPFALTMIENGGHTALIGDPGDCDALATVDARPTAWHEAMQVAIGRALRTGERAVLAFEPAALERGDAAGYFAETLDLIAGLVRAGSAEVAE